MKAKAYSSDNNIAQLNKIWPENSKLKAEIKLINEWKDKVRNYILAYNYFSIPHPEYTGSKLNSSEILKKFPMLEYVLNNYYRIKPEDVTTYIIEWAKLKGLEY
mgnify:CR=1 FL=1